MENAYLDTPLEIVLIRTEHLEQKYISLPGIFATLQDSCQRKQTLPGFYDAGLFEIICSQAGILQLRLPGQNSETDMIRTLDIALRNLGGFPYYGHNPASFFVELCNSSVAEV